MAAISLGFLRKSLQRLSLRQMSTLPLSNYFVLLYIVDIYNNYQYILQMSKVQPNLLQIFLFIKKGLKFVQLKEPLYSKLKSYELVKYMYMC